jgi:ParB-like nuclease domain
VLVKKIPLSSIIILPDRQRTDLGDVLDLANSIRLHGQLQPIIVNEQDDKYILIAGERRYTAHTLLKSETIDAVLQRDMTQDFMQIVEWEENFRRKQLDWKEECRTFLKLHEMKGEDWSIEKTGDFFGVEQQPAYVRILVGKALRDEIPYVMNAPNLTSAYKAAQRSMKRMVDREATNIIKAFDLVLPEPEVEEVFDNKPKVQETSILNEDFFTWARAYKGPKFSFIHLDPPYGIKHSRSEQGSAAMFPLYKDMPEDFLEFLSVLAEVLPNLIDDQAHIMLWYSVSKFSLTRKFIEQNFPDIRWGGSAKGDDPVPLIWHKDDATGIVPDPERYGRRVYETALCFSIGDRKIIRPVLNAFACGGRKTTDTRHVSEKPLEMLTHFFRMFIDEHTNVLDPCCGSGNSVIAAYKLLSPHSLGLELDPNVASESKVHLELATLNGPV